MGDEIARKGCSNSRTARAKAWWGHRVHLSAGRLRGQRGAGVCQEETRVVMLKNIAQASLQRAALAVGVLACSMVNIRLLLRKQ